MAQLREYQTNHLLGYPDDARLLLINADDLGMCHAVNEAIFRTLQAEVVRSTSLMVPCPWALQAMHHLKENPSISFGVHLTVICDTTNYAYRPLTSKENVPSLVDADGYFYPLERMDALVEQANLAELETEFRAQLETVLAADLKPSHLDWHCLHSGGRADIFDLTLGLAREYGLALRVGNQPFIKNTQRQGLPTNDYELMDSYDLETPDKSARYAQMLRDLPVGLTEWAVHPGLGNAELQAIEPDSWQVRQTDFEFLMSPLAQETIQAEGIILLDYRPLQALWRAATAP